MLRLLHMGWVLITGLSYLSPLVDPERFWPIATLGLLLPWLWLGMLFFALYWAAQKKRLFWLSLVVLVLGWDSMRVVFAIPKSTPDVSMGWTVATLNGFGFARVPGGDLLPPAVLAQEIRQLETDVISFQEFPRGSRGEAIQQAIIKATPMAYVDRNPDGGLAIFSRFPVKNANTTFFANRANGYQHLDIETPSGRVRLYNIHLQTNAVSGLADQVTTEGRLDEKETWRTIKGMFGRYGRASKKRVGQVRDILGEVADSPYPVILNGDFNEVPASYLYQLFAQDFKDAHLQRGWGLGATYSGKLPGLRIDYILFQDGLAVSRTRRAPISFSDHKAVIATMGKGS